MNYPINVFSFSDDDSLTEVFLYRISNPNASIVLLCDPSLSPPIDFCIEHDLEYTPWAGSVFSYVLAQPAHVAYHIPNWGKKNDYDDPQPTINTGTPSEILASTPNRLAAAKRQNNTSLTAAAELQPTALAQASNQSSTIAGCAIDASSSAAPSDWQRPHRGIVSVTETIEPTFNALYLTLPSKPLTLILIDPPWEYNSRHAGAETKARQEHLNLKGHGTKFSGGAEKHYHCPPFRQAKRKAEGWEKDLDLTMLTDQELLEVAAYIKAVSAPDAVMFCWVTSPQTWEKHFAYDFMVACGFAPKTSVFNWFKLTDDVPPAYIYGPGFYSASSMESCVVAVKGKGLGSPEVKMLPSIVQFDDLDAPVPMTKGTKATKDKEASLPKPCIALCPRGAHSSKPLIHHLVDSMYPGQEKMELFAREQVGNWPVTGSDTTGKDILEDLTSIINHLGLVFPVTTVATARKVRKKKEPIPPTPEPETLPLPFDSPMDQAVEDDLASALSDSSESGDTGNPSDPKNPAEPLCFCVNCSQKSFPYGPRYPSPQMCLNCGFVR